MHSLHVPDSAHCTICLHVASDDVIPGKQTMMIMMINKRNLADSGSNSAARYF